MIGNHPNILRCWCSWISCRSLAYQIQLIAFHQYLGVTTPESFELFFEGLFVLFAAFRRPPFVHSIRTKHVRAQTLLETNGLCRAFLSVGERTIMFKGNRVSIQRQ